MASLSVYRQTVQHSEREGEVEEGERDRKRERS